MIRYDFKCVCCNHDKDYLIAEANEAMIKAWLDGMLIQDAMPDVSVDIREALMTSICLECQDRFLTEDPEEEEYNHLYVMSRMREEDV